MALALVAASCGGEDAAQDPPPVGQGVARAQAASAEEVSSRPRDGVAAAGGNPAALGDGRPCAPDRPVVIAYLGPDLTQRGAIGLEELVIEEPSLVIDAYVDAVNALGGVDGRCVRTDVHHWAPADPAASRERICAQLPQAEPLFILSFLGDVNGIDCLTLRGDIPTLGLYASAPFALVDIAEGRLLLDDGTHEYLLENSIEVAQRAGYLSADAMIGFLRGADPSIDDQIAVALAQMDPRGLMALFDKYGIDVQSVAHLPPAFSEYSTLLPEQQVGLLGDDLGSAEHDAAQQARAALEPENAELLDRIEQFYLDAAAEYRDGGVDVVVSTAPWFELRRMMRAAESIDWSPWWIASDIQGATLTLTGAPAAQAERFLLVSARRAAGDEVPDLDRSCVVLRNMQAAAPPFSHRHHTDAWSAITATCDMLDIAFSALSRAETPLTRDSFVAAMRRTDYRAAYGGRITFASDDSSGADRFRVLEADPDCVLDAWGCMRALTDWLAPVAEARDVSGRS
ncbi:MAG: ABC transporter substrate-binding protein [Acidimicrobiaceae bacterium]|nr:ABC transporter substrate-binding protein [Acidimicrobiaceae bacterium]